MIKLSGIFQVQLGEWVSKDGMSKNFFYMRGGVRKFVVGKM